MTAFRRGDVVLVSFVFADESGGKLRPALVVSAASYRRSRHELVIAAITSNIARRLFGDHLLSSWREAGLLFPSVVTCILRTVDRTMIRRRLGSLQKADLVAVGRQLRASLGL